MAERDVVTIATEGNGAMCAVMAARLAAQRHLGTAALLAVAIATLAFTAPGACVAATSSSGGRITLALLTLLGFAGERYLMVRIALDAELFRILSTRYERGAGIDPLASLDSALARIGLVDGATASVSAIRPLDARIVGTRRLLLAHGACACALLVLAVIVAVSRSWPC